MPAATCGPSTGWHAQFEDVTNSGLVDLFIAKGNVSEMKDFAAKDPNNLLMQRADGTFVEMGEKAGILSFNQARGAALADFTLDGAVDLLVVNRNAPAQFWRNDTPALGHWLGLRAVAGRTPTATPSAAGSRSGPAVACSAAS